MSLLVDTETNRFWARVDFLATGEIALHIPEECELPIRVLVSRGGRSTEYEPSNSDIPNNCEELQYEMGMGTLKCDNCSEYGSFKCTKCDGEMYFKRLEPKDEPQTCGDCKHNGEKHAYDYACDKCTDMDKFQHEDEPQTERRE